MKGELIQAVVKMLAAHRTLVISHHPPFEERHNTVHVRK